MKVPPTSFPEGLFPPTPPHPQLTTTRVRLSASIPAPSVPGPAGLGGGPNCLFPEGAQVTSRVATCANCWVYLAQRCGKDCTPLTPHRLLGVVRARELR